MKKILSLMIGLTLALGTFAFAADEKPAAENATTEKKGKKKAAKKAADKAEEKKAEAPKQ